MRQIGEVHDAKNRRQAGGQQKQHQAELQPVQTMLYQHSEIHVGSFGGKVRRNQSAMFDIANAPWHPQY